MIWIYLYAALSIAAAIRLCVVGSKEVWNFGIPWGLCIVVGFMVMWPVCVAAEVLWRLRGEVR